MKVELKIKFDIPTDIVPCLVRRAKNRFGTTFQGTDEDLITKYLSQNAEDDLATNMWRYCTPDKLPT